MWIKVHNAFHMRCRRRILSIKWNDFISNVTAAATSGLDSIINIVRARRYSCDVPPSTILTALSAALPGTDIPRSFVEVLENGLATWAELAECQSK